VITIASGVTALDPFIFGIASLAAGACASTSSRHFSGIGAPGSGCFIDRYFGWLTLAFFVLLIGGFAVVALI
jgi:preprotein translocase subunit SecG